MVRAALGRNTRLSRGPRSWAGAVPAASVLVVALIALLPIVAAHGWGPDAGLVMLLAWRIRRADAWPAWWAAPMGFANDLVTGQPIGLSTAWWALVTLAMEVLDRRTMWRDYWLEWAIAMLFIAGGTTLAWKVAAWQGAPVPFELVLPNLLLGIMLYPLAAALVATLDRWRLG